VKSASDLRTKGIVSKEEQPKWYQFPLSPGQAILVFGQFDTMGGTRTLLSVEIMVKATMEAMVAIENNSVIPAPDAAVSLSGQQTLTIPGVDQILTQFPTSTLPSPGLDPSDGVSGSGSDFFDFGSIQVMGMSTELLEAGTDDLSTFIGTGTFNASVFAVGTFVASGATDATLFVSGFTGTGEIVIRYIFMLQPGACCLTDGTCVVDTAAACAALGGDYQGDDTSCVPGLCPQPPAPCPWDCVPPGGNGVVNIDDLLQTINEFGQPGGGACDVAPDNGDGTFGNGVINVDDVLAIINNTGPCP